ncbi:MAG: hypothetical protein AAGG56_17405 [Pseudomonadota bacterium]
MPIETGIFMADDDRLFFVTVIDTQFFAVGEDIDATEVVAMAGEFDYVGRFQGKWAHMPKGTATGFGVFELVETAEGFQSDGGDLEIGSWRRVEPDDLESFAPSDLHQAGFATERHRFCTDLTGLWLAQDGATGYIRQIDDTVFWLHEHPTALFEEPPRDRDRFTLFFGTVDTTDCGTIVSGSWAALPKELQPNEEALRWGALTLAPFGGGEIQEWQMISGHPHSFGEMRRVETEMIEVSFDMVRVDRTVPGLIDPGDDVLLRFGLIVADSQLVDFRNPSIGHVDAEVRSQFRQRNVQAGESTTISPELGRFRLILADWVGGWPRTRFQRASFAVGVAGVELQGNERETSRDVSIWRRSLGERWSSPPDMLKLVPKVSTKFDSSGNRYGYASGGLTVKQGPYADTLDYADASVRRGRAPGFRFYRYHSDNDTPVGWTQGRFSFQEINRPRTLELVLATPGEEAQWTVFGSVRRRSDRRLSDL